MLVRVAAEKVRLAILVAHAHQLLQAIHRELAEEVKEEVACIRIVAVAENRLAVEMLFVVPHLLFDIGELCIELVLLAGLRRVKLPCPSFPGRTCDYRVFFRHKRPRSVGTFEAVGIAFTHQQSETKPYGLELASVVGSKFPTFRMYDSMQLPASILSPLAAGDSAGCGHPVCLHDVGARIGYIIP